MSTLSDKFQDKRSAGRPRHLNHDEWTPEEIARLDELRGRGWTFTDIATELRRPRRGVREKYDKLHGGVERRAKARAEVAQGAKVSVGAGGGRAPVAISLGGPAWSRPARYQG